MASFLADECFGLGQRARHHRSPKCHGYTLQVTIINFTVTMTGLEDQLLVDVVKNERPDLEAKKDELVITSSTSK